MASILGHTFRNGKTRPYKLSITVGEDDCPSCHAHWMQSCHCTWEQINAAEKERRKLMHGRDQLFMKTVSGHEFFNLPEEPIKEDKKMSTKTKIFLWCWSLFGLALGIFLLGKS